MNILAIDTSTEICSVALLAGEQTLSALDDTSTSNTDVILPMIDQMMAQASLKPNQLDAIAFARGPGGFTGVRVAAGVAQGIAFGSDIPVAPISTLALLAQAVYQRLGKTQVWVANDARMNEVYSAAYNVGERLMETVCEEALSSPEAINMPNWGVQQSALRVGSAWLAYEERFDDAVAQIPFDESIVADAQYLIPLAQQLSKNNGWVSAEHAQPIYLRNQVAKKKAER